MEERDAVTDDLRPGRRTNGERRTIDAGASAGDGDGDDGGDDNDDVDGDEDDGGRGRLGESETTEC